MSPYKDLDDHDTSEVFENTFRITIKEEFDMSDSVLGVKNCQMRKISIDFDYKSGQELYGMIDESLKVCSGHDAVGYIDVEVKEPLYYLVVKVRLRLNFLKLFV